MTLPNNREFKLKIKWYLSSYRVCGDCRYAISGLREERPAFSSWRVQWAGICALLKTSIHLLGKKDARACLPPVLRQSLKDAWVELGRRRSEFPLFWEFIDKERNNILKEYDISAYPAIIRSDGTVDQTSYSLLYMLGEAEEEALILRGGPYDGQFALDVAADATDWAEGYILQAIRNAGFDPEEEVRSSDFLNEALRDMGLLSARTGSAS
ncbi:hypothetical protein [Mesorhizobium sp. B2-3-10]|uniref:hypothetical protein n=1 Tax=Mesorhizobium sp. B2-3-10 TaxID=2589954 RepID=UPI001127DB2E|nr:hypothetical protein [Mesorhizobium sp. B2-3-10]TPL97442.1 hypothetical protein FJ943_18950 [Mesorhizobium sp. B2-3-10]